MNNQQIILETRGESMNALIEQSNQNKKLLKKRIETLELAATRNGKDWVKRPKSKKNRHST